MVAEVTVIVKNEEKVLKTNHLIYDDFMASDSDPIIAQLIRDTSKQFNTDGDDITDIKVKINLQVK